MSEKNDEKDLASESAERELAGERDSRQAERTSHLNYQAKIEGVLEAEQRKCAEMSEALGKYRVAMDALYNHNEAVRAAVVQHFGTLHPQAALASQPAPEGKCRICRQVPIQGMCCPEADREPKPEMSAEVRASLEDHQPDNEHAKWCEGCVLAAEVRRLHKLTTPRRTRMETKWPCRKCGDDQDYGPGELCTYCGAKGDLTIND